LVRTQSCPLHTLNLRIRFVRIPSRADVRPVLELFSTRPWDRNPLQEFSAMRQWTKAAAELLFMGLCTESVCATGGVRDTIVSEPGHSSTNVSITIPYANATAEECWRSWDEYWSVSQSIKNPKTSNVASMTSTSTVTMSDYSGTTRTDVVTFTGISLQDNGGFTLSTRTSGSTSSSTYTMRPRPGSTFTITTTLTSYKLMSYDGTPVPEPSCKLPSVVPQCQSQWEEYIESELIPSPTPLPHCDVYQGRIPALTWETTPACASSYNNALTSYRQQLSSIRKPPCTQASIGGDLCDTVKDAYVHQQNSNFLPDVSFAPYFSNGYLGSFQNITAQDYKTAWWWPTSSTLGVPSCTLGCGR
jgi:hypothetical protein